MSSFVSAFDEAPKTPTRSFTTSKHKVVVASPENTPPSSPSSKSTRRTNGSRVPLAELKALSEASKLMSEPLTSDKKSESIAAIGLGASGSASSSAAATDTFSISDALDYDNVSVISQSRFEQIENEVALLRDEIKTFESLKASQIIEDAEEPEPLLSEPSKTDLKFAELEATIAALTSQIQVIQAQKQQIPEPVIQQQEVILPERDDEAVWRRISEKRNETLVSAFFPFLSEQKSGSIAKWMTERMDFSIKSTMRRIWSAILILDFMAVFLESRMNAAHTKYVPKGWYKRFSAMRYCLELLLVVQFGIAAQQLITNPTTISVFKRFLTGAYNVLHTLFVKVLPTGLIIAATASSAAWLYRNRLAKQILL